MSCERFEECYRKYRDCVTRIIYEKTGDRSVADDITQDVFLAFFQNMYKVTPELEKAFLYRCAKNASIDYIRRMSRRMEIRLDVNSIDHEFAQTAGSIEALEKRMDYEALLRDISEELKAVNPHWYDAVLQFCVRELSCEEAARRLGVSENVLRARVHRARSFVRERFGDEFYEDREMREE